MAITAWWPEVANTARDGDVIMFGASTSDVCTTVARDGRLLVEGREIGLSSVVLVHRQGDHINHAGRFKGYHHVVEATWWGAIGRAAPAAYQLRGDEVLRVRVQIVARGR